jgi:hypothetical protein
MKGDLLMRKTMMFGFAFSLALGLIGFATAQTTAQDEQKAMEAYMKAGAVTENHAYLKKLAGAWTAKTTMWMAPGQPPSESGGTIEGRLIMGGRFVVMDFKGTMMGQPFEGFQISGYDNMLKKYTTLWIDNTSTAFFMLAGALDAKNVLIQTGEWADPMSGITKVRAVVRFPNPDEYVWEQYMVMPDGKEFKSMEMRCTRK